MARQASARRPRAEARPAAPARASAPPAPSDDIDFGGLDTATGYVIRRAQMAIFGDFAARFAELGLKPAQYSTLQIAAANPGLTQSAIGAALGILRPNFVSLLDELERRGLARRVKSKTDRRSHAISLTPAGEALLERARAVQAAQETRIREILGDHGQSELIALSTKLWQAL